MTGTVVALDPGGTTGYAVWHGGQSFYHGQMGPDEHHHDLWNYLAKLKTAGGDEDLTIVCESFEFRQNRQRDNIELISKEYIGVVKLFRESYHTPVVFQTAALGKGFITDEKLKAMGIWKVTMGERHARDAYRHLYFYLINRLKHYEFMETWKDL